MEYVLHARKTWNDVCHIQDKHQICPMLAKHRICVPCQKNNAYASHVRKKLGIDDMWRTKDIIIFQTNRQYMLPWIWYKHGIYASCKKHTLFASHTRKTQHMFNKSDKYYLRNSQIISLLQYVCYNYACLYFRWRMLKQVALLSSQE